MRMDHWYGVRLLLSSCSELRQQTFLNRGETNYFSARVKVEELVRDSFGCLMVGLQVRGEEEEEEGAEEGEEEEGDSELRSEQKDRSSCFCSASICELSYLDMQEDCVERLANWIDVCCRVAFFCL